MKLYLIILFFFLSIFGMYYIISLHVGKITINKEVQLNVVVSNKKFFRAIVFYQLFAGTLLCKKYSSLFKKGIDFPTIDYIIYYFKIINILEESRVTPYHQNQFSPKSLVDLTNDYSEYPDVVYPYIRNIIKNNLYESTFPQNNALAYFDIWFDASLDAFNLGYSNYMRFLENDYHTGNYISPFRAKRIKQLGVNNTIILSYDSIKYFLRISTPISSFNLKFYDADVLYYGIMYNRLEDMSESPYKEIKSIFFNELPIDIKPENIKNIMKKNIEFFNQGHFIFANNFEDMNF